MDDSTNEFDWRTIFDTPEYKAYELDCDDIFSVLHSEQGEPIRFLNGSEDSCDDLETQNKYKKVNSKLREILGRSLENTCLDDIKAYLLPYDKEQRCKIVRQCGGQKPLIYSAVTGKYLDVIEYFLKECEVDVNVKTDSAGYGNIMGLGSNFEVTPLVVACMHGDIEVVKMLVDNGAEICWMDAKNPNPIHAAICKGHLEIVQYLMESTRKVDIKNSAAFLSFIPNEEMLQYLLSKGFDPNMKDSKGFTSLHRALHSDMHFYSNHKTVEMLLQAGADLNIKDSDGFDSVIVAAKEKDRKSFYLLSSQATASEISVVNGYELLGAVYILQIYDRRDPQDSSDGDDNDGSHEFWSRALSLRYADPLNPILKPVMKPKEIFEFATEFQTLDELEALRHQPSLVLYNQAALILERVIGWNHPFTLRHLSESLAQTILENYNNHKKCFDVLMYTRNAHLDRDKCSGMSVWIMEAMIKVIYRACYSRVLFRKEPIDLLKKIFKQIEDVCEEVLPLLEEDNLHKDDIIFNENQFHGLSETDDVGSESERSRQPVDGSHSEISGETEDGDPVELSFETAECVPVELSLETDEGGPVEHSLETDEGGPIKLSPEIGENSRSEFSCVRHSENKTDGGQCKEERSLVDRENLVGEYLEQLQWFSRQSLHLFVYLLAINNLKFTKDTEALFCKYVADDMRGEDDESILHIVSYILSNFEIRGENYFRYNVRYPVISALFDYLLAFRADVNSLDAKGNTPLHYALKPTKYRRQPCKGMKMNATAEKLIKHGAHLDYFNDNGECTLDTLREMDHNIDEINISSLQCIAARAVVQYDRSLTKHLPLTLRHTCRLHWNRKR